jgi:hypothetical protein
MYLEKQSMHLEKNLKPGMVRQERIIQDKDMATLSDDGRSGHIERLKPADSLQS